MAARVPVPDGVCTSTTTILLHGDPGAIILLICRATFLHRGFQSRHLPASPIAWGKLTWQHTSVGDIKMLAPAFHRETSFQDMRIVMEVLESLRQTNKDL